MLSPINPIRLTPQDRALLGRMQVGWEQESDRAAAFERSLAQLEQCESRDMKMRLLLQERMWLMEDRDRWHYCWKWTSFALLLSVAAWVISLLPGLVRWFAE